MPSTKVDIDSTLTLHRRDWKLHPDPAHVICRPHMPGGGPLHIENVIDRVLRMSSSESKRTLDRVKSQFSVRHRHLYRTLEQHFNLVESYVPNANQLSTNHKLLIGAYFTMEYAVASAALFNPSIVPHPNQQDVKSKNLRFIMSLRAVGEGHISSIVFRSGTIGKRCKIHFDEASHYVETAKRKLNPNYDKHLFLLKLDELNEKNEVISKIFESLPEHFSFSDLQTAIDRMFHQSELPIDYLNDSTSTVNWLANSNYELTFDNNQSVNERVIYPTSDVERGGIEDARFVQFMDDNGKITYYATYTAFNGSSILPQLIETQDFKEFRMVTLNGNAAQNKGMALFPRKINGKYAMLSRQDGEKNYIMFSPHLHFWQQAEPLQHPEEPWEFIQIGNCGSPLETPQGWIVLTHGVGPMRQYSIGAILLDLDDPSRILAKLKQPLLSPLESEREGYVPNVVYSCGALIHNGELIIPYAMSDIRSGVVSVKLNDLLNAMVAL